VRISIVPAQITTVEDKIAGNLTVQQAAYLGIPVLFGFVAAVLFPPSGEFSTYKIVLIVIVFVLSALLAVRIKGRIVAQWLVLLAKFAARPRYFVYDKNSSYLRTEKSHKGDEVVVKETVEIKKKIGIQPLKMAQHEVVRLEQFARDSRAGVRFEVGKKGKLYVHVTEVN
jgi:hypothetical protein